MTSLVHFNIDFTAHEGARLAAVLDAMGTNWDPHQIYTDETEAQRMLYANLDPDQQATYDALIANGVLPNTPEAIR
ncbi:MAG: DUF6400 family protein [Pseudonocardiaceae bacterium]